MLRCSTLTEHYDIHHIANYDGPGIPKTMHCDDALIKKCICFLYHPVKNRESLQSIDYVRKNLSKNTLALPMPYITSNLYWPLFLDRHSPIGISRNHSFGLFPYSSYILNEIIDRVDDVQKIVDLWNSIDPSDIIDTDMLLQQTLSKWDTLERDSGAWLGINTYLKENWRKKLLFYVYNHPSKDVFLYIANKILNMMNCDSLSIFDIKGVNCGQDGIYPINSITAKTFALQFITDTSRFTYDGKFYTSDEFIAFYIDCYRNCKNN